MSTVYADRLRAAFARDGWVTIRRAVEPATMESLMAQIARELEAPSIAAESGEASASLDRPATWPSGGSRRVLEVTPPGDAAHWAELVASPRLVAALDAILGEGGWELPVNAAAPTDGGRVPVRHWYAPVAFPDERGGCDDPAGSWAPVNRRGERWRGWHVDIGPGFDTGAARTSEGHPFQGAVVLLLGSGWSPGGGGTALIRGSHRWVAAALREVGERGVPHDELNGWSAREAGARREAGCLRLARESGGGRAAAGEPPREEEVAASEAEVLQVCGEAGDVVLLHPWLVHGGTSNRAATPRVLVNGMARVTAEAFAAHGVRSLALLSAPPPSRSGEASAGRASSAGLAACPAGEPCPAGELRASLGEPSKRPPDEALLLPPPKRPSVASAESLAAEVARLGAAAEGRPRDVDPSLPHVSLVVPAHNAAWCLDEALASVLAQTYRGPLEVSIFDDGSSDGTRALIEAWIPRLRAARVDCVASGSRWGGDAHAEAGGIGFAKNRAVAQSSGSLLAFLDADDVMLPRRVELQVAALSASPRSLVGGAWRRWPDGATAHHEAWAHSLNEEGLWLHQFRETTVQMPTWAMARATFDAVGGFEEVPAEDLLFFHAHLDRAARAERPLLRVGSREEPLLLYRWTASSMTSTVDRRTLLQARAAAFERRVLSDPRWATFTVWGAGRDGKAFVAALSAAARSRVVALADINPRKVGELYTNHRLRGSDGALLPPFTLPVVHTRDIRGPVAVCVSLRRAEEGGEGEIQRVARGLGLVEGETLWYMF